MGAKWGVGAKKKFAIECHRVRAGDIHLLSIVRFVQLPVWEHRDTKSLRRWHLGWKLHDINAKEYQAIRSQANLCACTA